MANDAREDAREGKSDRDELKQLKRIAHAAEMSHADLHGLLIAVRDIQDAASSIACTLKQLVTQPPTPGPGNLHARAGSPVSDLGDTPMSPVTIPVKEMLDTEKEALSIMPRKADGHIDALAQASWVNNDEANIGLLVGTEAFDFEDIRIAADGVTEEWREVVTCPGNFRAWALTPNASGSGATITVSAPGYVSATFGPFVYKQGVALSLNASVGDPVSDL